MPSHLFGLKTLSYQVEVADHLPERAGVLFGVDDSAVWRSGLVQP
ncbi:hypothetical protein [Botrimarina mediterranea]|nr:hypothetical protein [Botrimarina mediterranea]